MTDPRILILGGGPAGGAVALGLRRLGYSVTLVCQPRPFAAVEGVSVRVLQGLHNAGFRQALQGIPQPSLRQASWNGEHNDANSEHLIDRETLDRGILADLEVAGVEVVQQRAGALESKGNGWRLTLASGGAVSADFLVEARGRMAPSAHLSRLRGPETLSLLQYWQGPAGDRGSAAVSCENGWVWMARTESGRRYLQLTLDVGSSELPPRAELAGFCEQHFRSLPEAAAFVTDAHPVGDVQARTSTAILCQEAIGDNWIRVGDAAMAVDPLSGNGIFQALSSALQAPAVINTLLTQPQHRALARQFHQQRVDGLFYRFARIGRDFYGMETRWQDTAFWQTRATWPDAEPLHQSVTFDEVRVAEMPVVQDNLIVPRQVVVTPDQPLGIWHLSGLPLAPVVNAVRQRGEAQSLADCLAPLGLAAPQQQLALNWLSSLGITS